MQGPRQWVAGWPETSITGHQVDKLLLWCMKYLLMALDLRRLWLSQSWEQRLHCPLMTGMRRRVKMRLGKLMMKLPPSHAAEAPQSAGKPRKAVQPHPQVHTPARMRV